MPLLRVNPAPPALVVVALVLSSCSSTTIKEPAHRVNEINSLTEVNQLIVILRDDSVPLNRAAAATTLAGLGNKIAVDPLIEGLEDSDAGVRRDCAHALGMLADPRATKKVCRALLNDNVVAVRRASARALHDIGSKEAIKPLIRALADSNESVVYNAHRALVEITDRTDLGRSPSEWMSYMEEK